METGTVAVHGLWPWTAIHFLILTLLLILISFGFRLLGTARYTSRLEELDQINPTNMETTSVRNPFP